MYTHTLGELTLTVLSDGPIELPEGSQFYVGGEHDCETVAELNELPARFSQNPLIIDSPHSGRTLIDAGVGCHTLLDSARFGPNAGQLSGNLTAAGIDPASVDRVLITHLHPDHAWGIANSDGSKAFPNATVHVHRDEIAHWTNLTGVNVTTPATEANRKLGALFVLRAYGEKLHAFEGTSQIAADITAVPSPGHTPGHSVYWVNSNAGRLVSWGDTCHHEAQISSPTVSASTDVDESALRLRQQLLEDLAHEDVLVHAYHLPFPGLGSIAPGESAFAWVPSGTPATPETPLSGGTS